jgi:uncharacterized protein
MNAQDQTIMIQKTLDYINELHFNEFSGHDNEHVIRVWTMAKRIAASEPQANLFIVELAALLHDVDDYKLSLGKADGNNAHRFMEEMGIEQAIQERVLEVINSIGFSKSGFNPQLPNIEAKIVYDADKLEALGAIGIARAFAYGGNKQRKLFEPSRHPEQFDLASYRLRSVVGGNHSIAHLFEKSLKLPNVMQTKAGAELARKRQITMFNFLNDFFAEQNLSDWQELLIKHSA